MTTGVAALPTIVQFGAGCIGRGFLGQLWTEGGYEVIFVDVDEPLIAALEARRRYPLRLVDNEQTETRVLQPVRATLGGEARAPVIAALRQCTFAAAAVGVHAFPHLAPIFAEAVCARAEQPVAPAFNILCCENQLHAARILREAVARLLPGDDATQQYFAERVAFVDTIVGRMVPSPTDAMRAEDPLLIAAEPYTGLFLDGGAWRGAKPAIPGVALKTDFADWVTRKLFTHNGGHACLAYHGFLRGHEYIWQAAGDAALVAAELRGFWQETGDALVRAFGFDAGEQRQYESDLLHRFGNRILGDTIVRVAQDPARKLRREDRLIGPALLCLRHGILPVHIARAIAAALRFDAPDVREAVTSGGVRSALASLAGVPGDSPLVALVEEAYNELSAS